MTFLDAHREKLIHFFLDPKSYDGVVTGQPKLLHETHLSLIFAVTLDGENLVYKLAKAVDIGVGDYADAEQRHENIKAEFDVNRKWSPDLYRAIVPVYEKNGQLTFTKHSDPVEYALCMVQFEDTLDRLLEQGKLDDSTLIQVMDRMVTYDRQAPLAGEWGPRQLKKYLDEAWQQIDAAVCDGRLDRKLATRLGGDMGQRILRCFEDAEPWLEERKTTHVKLVHGDLHLGNIAMLNGVAQPFDGIAFNDELMHTDVFGDKAWLIVDLMAHGETRQANLMLNRYLERSDDFGCLPVMRIYLVERALVRAKVACLKLAQSLDAADRKAQHGEAEAYIKVIEDVLKFNDNRLFGVGGLSGSGKSTVARELAGNIAPGLAVIIKTDAIRKHLFGCGLDETAPPQAYTPAMSRRTYLGLHQRILLASVAGMPIFADATWLYPDGRDQLKFQAIAVDYGFTGIWCDVPQAEAERRITAREKEGKDVSDANVEIYRNQLKSFNTKSVTWRKLDASGTPEQVLEEAKKLL